MIERGILYVVHPTTNSSKQHLLLLIKYLNRARYKPYLVTSDEPYLVEHLKKLDIEFIVVPDIATANKLNVGTVASKIEEFVSEREVNLVHSHDYQACYVADHVAKALDIPHICTIHTLEGDHSHKKKGFLHLPNEKIAAMPDHIIAVSEVVKKTIEGLSNVSLIYNGVEAERFAETLDTEHLYRELGVTRDNWLIGAITRLSPEKGTDSFLEAAAILLKSNPEMHFVIAGEGSDEDALISKASKLGLSKNVHFLGFRRDVAHILKSLQVVVIPNLSPALPMALLEALACKKPIVVTDVPGVREVVTEEIVEFVPPGDSVAIAAKVSEILSHRIKAISRVQSGQKLISDKFTIQNMLKPTESLYLQIAK